MIGAVAVSVVIHTPISPGALLASDPSASIIILFSRFGVTLHKNLPLSFGAPDITYSEL